MRITLCTIRVREGAAHAQSRELDAPEGASVGEALAAAGVTPADSDGLSVFGRRVTMLDVLSEGDRLEVSPRLLVDPREARRRRAERQGDVRVVTCGRHGGRRRPEAE